MKFDYDYYRNVLLFVAIGILIAGIFLIISGIHTLRGKTFANSYLPKSTIVLEVNIIYPE